MIVPTPKYSIGNKVWGAGFSAHTQIRETCPDCLGAKEWSCTTPAGDTFNVPCSTCMEGYFCSGSIVRWGPSQSAQRLTIGSVRIDTGDENPVQYMCQETGIGCGSIWYEKRLFDTEAEALAYSAAEGLKYAEQMNAQNAERRARELKRNKRKPSFHERRIKELEAQLAELAKVSP